MRDSPADAPRSLGVFHRSKTVTVWPRRASCQADMVPTIPPPTTATRFCWAWWGWVGRGCWVGFAVSGLNLGDLQGEFRGVEEHLETLDRLAIADVERPQLPYDGCFRVDLEVARIVCPQVCGGQDARGVQLVDPAGRVIGRCGEDREVLVEDVRHEGEVDDAAFDDDPRAAAVELHSDELRHRGAGGEEVGGEGVGLRRDDPGADDVMQAFDLGPVRGRAEQSQQTAAQARRGDDGAGPAATLHETRLDELGHRRLHRIAADGELLHELTLRRQAVTDREPSALDLMLDPFADRDVL